MNHTKKKSSNKSGKTHSHLRPSPAMSHFTHFKAEEQITPLSPNLQSHALLQTYGAILPTSLTYVILFNQRFLTLETCCGYWYGRLWKNLSFFTPFGFHGLIVTPHYLAFSKTSPGKYLFISDLVSNWFISEVFDPQRKRQEQSLENKLKRKDNFSQSYD